MARIVLIISIICFILNAQEQQSSISLVKQKIEVKELKKQLNDFYNKKEKEYQKRKQELQTLLKKIEKEKNEIKIIRDNNNKILEDIKGTVDSKTAKIYNKMKPKVAAGIFNKMMDDGKIEDVFDIIVKLKENVVTNLMKFLTPKNAAMITIMLKDYKIKN